MAEYPKASPIFVDYEDVMSENGENIFDKIEGAFGPNGIGLIVVKNVPDLKQKRFDLLKLGHRFATLSDEVKAKYEHAMSKYSFGWSHGKESLKKGQFDIFKGSYYNNPIYDVPTEDPELIEKYPEVCSPNIWPKDDLPELEPSFKSLGQLITDVGNNLARHCDNYTSHVLGDAYEKDTLQRVLQESRTCKGRLLYYFPLPEDGERTIDSWCGWHNDHSLLTGLCPALYRDIRNDGDEEIDNPDINAGLYAKNRKGEILKVGIPRDCIAFQIGLTAQVLTGGVLVATPHCVRAVKYPESSHTSRTTLAVFMQPNFDVVMKEPEKIQKEGKVEHFKEGMNFGDFGKSTISVYYGY